MDIKKVIEIAFPKPFFEQVKIHNGKKYNHTTFPAGNAGCGGQEEELDMQAQCLNRFFFFFMAVSLQALFYSTLLYLHSLLFPATNTTMFYIGPKDHITKGVQELHVWSRFFCPRFLSLHKCKAHEIQVNPL